MLTLYFSPMACSLAARITALEAGLTLNYQEVTLGNKTLVASQQSYLDITAKGKVPVVEIAKGEYLSENVAVLTFLADMAPNSGLAPGYQDPQRYRLQECLNFISTELHKAVLYPLFDPLSTPAAIEYAMSKLPLVLTILQTRLQTGAYVFGEYFSIADAYLIWTLLLLQHRCGDLMAGYPQLGRYLQKQLARPAVHQSVELERKLYKQSLQAIN